LPRTPTHRSTRGVATSELVLIPVLPRHLSVVIPGLLFSNLELGELGHVLVHVLGPREILRSPLCQICEEVPGKADDFRADTVLTFIGPSGLRSSDPSSVAITSSQQVQRFSPLPDSIRVVEMLDGHEPRLVTVVVGGADIEVDDQLDPSQADRT